MPLKNYIHKNYFSDKLEDIDFEVAEVVKGELHRQMYTIDLIASENLVSNATLDAIGSVVVNKTVEGYPGKRYYGGVQYADAIENLAIERAKLLFKCEYANVQPHSGSQANQAVYLALLEPGDTILSMALDAGGHLSHGAKANLTGKWMNVVHYGVNKRTGVIDLEEVKALAIKHMPKLIICGGSAYPREINFREFRAIADVVGAYLMADIAHISGLVAGGVHLSPTDYAHIITATTYKNLRGVRGGIILTNYSDLSEKINKAVFPGLQGSSILNNIMAKAVCLGEALRPEFKIYAEQILANARCLANTLKLSGVKVVTGSTDTPLVLVDLRPLKLSGSIASDSLERSGLTCNKNLIPGDYLSPALTSGLRFGVAGATTRGFSIEQFKIIGNLIGTVLDGLRKQGQKQNRQVEKRARDQVLALCKKYPIYSFIERKKGIDNVENTDFKIKKYSVRISGHLTSVSMEKIFWDNLKSLATQRNQSVNSLIGSIDRDRKGNLSSAIRVFVHRHWQKY